MVALRSPRRPAEPAAAPPVEPVAAPIEPVTPPSDSPMADTLEVARDSIPLPQSGPDVSPLQQQLAAVKQAELVQRQALESQRQIAAAMQIETAAAEGTCRSYRKRIWNGLERVPTFKPIQRLAKRCRLSPTFINMEVREFYQALDLRYPGLDFRRENRNIMRKPPALWNELKNRSQRSGALSPAHP